MGIDRRVRAVARGVALGDQLAVVEHDYRLGQARVGRIGFGEGLIECAAGRRVGRFDHGRRPGAGDRCGLEAGRLGYGATAVREQAAESVAVDRPRGEVAEYRCAYFAPGAINLVVDRPADDAHQRQLFLGEGSLRIDS